MAFAKIIPVHKDDQEAMVQLRLASPEQIIAEAGELVDWLEDGNWPVSRDIADILQPHVNAIKAELIRVLRGNDTDWKYTCLKGVIIPARVDYLDNELISELQMLLDKPEWQDTLDAAQEALKKWT